MGQGCSSAHEKEDDVHHPGWTSARDRNEESADNSASDLRCDSFVAPSSIASIVQRNSRHTLRDDTYDDNTEFSSPENFIRITEASSLDVQRSRTSRENSPRYSPALNDVRILGISQRSSQKFPRFSAVHRQAASHSRSTDTTPRASAAHFSPVVVSYMEESDEDHPEEAVESCDSSLEEKMLSTKTSDEVQIQQPSSSRKQRRTNNSQSLLWCDHHGVERSHRSQLAVPRSGK